MSGLISQSISFFLLFVMQHMSVNEFMVGQLYFLWIFLHARNYKDLYMIMVVNLYFGQNTSTTLCKMAKTYPQTHFFIFTFIPKIITHKSIFHKYTYLPKFSSISFINPSFTTFIFIPKSLFGNCFLEQFYIFQNKKT